MTFRDAIDAKERIIRYIKARGPSLPVQIAKEIETSILFASVFLSELFSEKKLEMSNLRIGSSPLYYLTEQKNALEKFTYALKNKEKEAFELIKEKKILKDSEQEPAIRVALNEIKDFVNQFKKEGELYWKFYSISDQELIEILKNETTPIKDNKKLLEEKDGSSYEKSEKEKIKSEKLEVHEKKGAKKSKILKKEKKEDKKISSRKKEETFFNKVKEILSEKSIEILDIDGFNKDELRLKVKENGEEKILLASRKKRIEESDFLEAQKRASELGLRYIILSFGKIPKKIGTFIDAVRNLCHIEEIEP